MSFTRQQIAQRLGGRVAGDPGILIRQVGSLEGATREHITFLASDKHKAKLAQMFEDYIKELFARGENALQVFIQQKGTE